MNPKKSKEFIKPTAEDLDLPESLVENVVKFYWDNVKQDVSNFNYVNVCVEKLGTFKLKPKKVIQEIRMLKSTLKLLETEEASFNNHKKMQNCKDRLLKLESVHQEYLNELTRKLLTKQKRKEYEKNNADN